MASEAPIDEIIVRGRKPKGSPGGFPGGGPSRPPERPGGPGTPAPPGLVFLPPAAVVQPVEEIIVTAKRQAAARTFGQAVARFAGWPLALVSGIYSLDRYRQQLENELDQESKRDAEIRRMNRLRQEQPLPEIVVLAPSPAAPPLPQLVPARISPLITPDTDPFIMVPFEPLPMPMPSTPATAPDVEVSPITAPTIPNVSPIPGISPAVFPAGLPRIAPQRRVRPEIRPRIRPQTSPEVAPAPSPAPSPAPAPSVSPQPAVSPQVNPFGAVSPGVQLNLRRIPLTRRQPTMRTLAEAQLLQNTGQKKCKPCKEDNEPREKCYRKMVKEAFLPRFDQEYNWAEIDCVTGREI